MVNRGQPKLAEVTGCGDCPVASYESGCERCAHPFGESLSIIDDRNRIMAEAPDWCPLRQGPVTLRLRT